MEQSAPSHNIKKKIIKICVGVLIAILVYFIVSVVIVDIVYTDLQFKEHFDYESFGDPSEFDLQIREQTLKASDGIRIHTYEVLHEDPEGIVIMLTGITGPSVTQFYGEAKLVHDAGFASLLVDARGHGKSGGDKITFAIEDVMDVDAAVEYIKSRNEYKDKPIIVMGLSMGGATAINAGSTNSNIDGIIALSPYSSWTDVCIELAEAQGFPRWVCELLRPGVIIHGFLNFGVNYFRIVPEETIKQAGDKPILIMRSTRDAIVSMANHDRLLSSYEGANLEEFIRDGDEHHVVKGDKIYYPFDDIDYCNAILNFLEKFKDEKE